MATIPTHTTVLVVGGGPAGAFSAAVLAQEGINVVCCEATKFPRYHIGESLLASAKSFLKLVDACEKMEDVGFHRKPGSAVKFRPDRPEAYTDFIAVDPTNGAWNVERAKFDDLLLKHAAEKGAEVYLETRIGDVNLQNRPYSASWSNKGQTGTITFDYIVDCSGRQGILSTKLFDNRQFNETLKNVATWSYWTGNTGTYGKGTSREGAIWIEGLVDGPQGWVWYIPLKGKVSVGVILDETENTLLRRECESTKEHYLKVLEYAPGAKAFLRDAEISDIVRTASDFSYSASHYAGDGWRMAGDAGAFIDPFYSSGVHLALNGGLSAALSVVASIRGHVSEELAAAYHDKKISSSYTRFLLVVLASYKQLRAQNLDILCDPTSANFDAAFDIIRPIIQGTGDVDVNEARAKVAESMGKAMDFVANIMNTSTQEILSVERSGEVVNPMVNRVGNVTGPDEIAEYVQQINGDEKTERVLRSINARKIIKLYDPMTNFETEEVHGLVARLARGNMGLQAVH
ncbi:hypothetical protein CPB83DRAFT_856550 [Crepidotus variabilis]|uniref:FAD-binding domain-containing protein n=1 Tax=Crepidotus variabilis TaxID=179855 RepID=A0A9P6EDT7_9AGAR|nr:hypothetical protein CPB83DRAFT_856550 [Crepidotus variabilis]